MKDLSKNTKKIDFNRLMILISLSFILLIGLFMVYSSSSIWAKFYYNDAFYYLKRQVIFTLIGFILLYLFYKVKLSFLRKHSFKILLLGFISLILVIIPGLGSQINGSRSWFKIGSFLLQPAEIFKLIIVLYMADKLDQYYDQTRYFFKTIVVLLIPSLLGFMLIMLQPDFGTGIVMLASVLMMCILSKNKFKNYLVIGGCGIVAFTILIMNSAYRSERILAFINPYVDPLGSGFQSIQSMYAIGPGGILGKGIDSSYQKHFYLPEPQTDFIFSIFAEDFGFIGCAILILLYGVFIHYMLKMAKEENSRFKSFLNIGIASLIIIQVSINLCVVVGLIPVTGITLPFMSYGGSSITMLLAGIGLLLNKNEENKNEHIAIR